jgi:hypothetical protein
MLRHRRLTDVDPLDDLAHREWAAFASEQVQDLDPSRVGQAPKPARIDLRLHPREIHRLSTIYDKYSDANLRSHRSALAAAQRAARLEPGGAPAGLPLEG